MPDAPKDNSWEITAEQRKSIFIQLAEDLDSNLVQELVNFEGIRKFRATDEFGHGRVLGAKFPATFAGFVESLAEDKELGFHSKSNFLRASVHLMAGICSVWREDIKISSGIRQYLANDVLLAERAYREEAIRIIGELRVEIHSLDTPESEKQLAEIALKEFTASENEVVRKEAESVLKTLK